MTSTSMGTMSKPRIKITISGPQGSGKTLLARAIREMLLESTDAVVGVNLADIGLDVVDCDGSIEALHYCRGLHVEIVTVQI